MPEQNSKTPEFNHGDLIEAVKGDDLLRGRGWFDCSGPMMVGSSGCSTDGLTTRGYTVRVIEKAKPPLPSEPGITIRWESPYCMHLAILEKADQWLHCERTYTNAQMVVRIADTVQGDYAFTPLRPAAEVAAEVIADMEREYETAFSSANALENVAVKWGATS